jgi:CRP/FNR family transcriptional regulator, polysaccharide utilization system transcription regulator
MKFILIIEDNKEIRDNIEEILVLSGYAVETAENGKIGLTKLNQRRPDLILCDIMMPELDGYGVLHIIANNPSLATIPFIFLTSKSEKIDLRKGMSLGANDYITKPFDDLDLLQSIDIQLHKKELIDLKENFKLKTLEVVSSNYFNEKIKEIHLDYELRSYRKKELVFEEGTKAKYIYFIVRGKVKIYRTNDFGKELTTRIVSDGETFGFLDLLNGKSYSKSAQFMEDTIVSLIPIKKFLDLFNEDSAFTLSLVKHLAMNSSILESGNLHHAYSSVRRKVANAILQYYRKNESNSTMHILRDDLASISGSAKETVIRTLSDFKNEGIIDIEDSSITIKDLKKLIEMPQ